MKQEAVELTYSLTEPEDIDEWVKLTTNLLWTTLHQQRTIELLLNLKIDPKTGSITKNITVDLRDRERGARIPETIEYINANPLFSLSVDEVKTTYRQGYESPYIHKALKSGKLTERPAETIHVTPLTFHALTTGIHRFGMSQKFVVAQYNFMQDIAPHLGINIPEEYKQQDSEKHGSLAALASSMLVATQIPPTVYGGGLTTTIWKVKDCEVDKLREESINLLTLLHLNVNGHIELELERSEGGEPTYTAKIGECRCGITTIGDKTFGRVFAKLVKILQDIEKHVPPGEIILAIESTEQTSPLDLTAITSKLEEKDVSIRELILVATPLSLLSTYIALKYSKETGGARKIILSSGTDRIRIKETIKYILQRARSYPLVYIYGGTTLHSAIATYILSKDERATMIPKP